MKIALTHALALEEGYLGSLGGLFSTMNIGWEMSSDKLHSITQTPQAVVWAQCIKALSNSLRTHSIL